MFDDALLESSLSRSPVLRGIHWAISAAAGLFGLAATWWFLPDVVAQLEGSSLLLASSLAGLLCAGYALMGSYVWEDANRLRLRKRVWLLVTLSLNLAGFLIYLIRSASRSGNWKRAATALAYVLQAASVAILAALPLASTDALSKQVLQITYSVPSPPAGLPSARTVPPREKPSTRARVDVLKSTIIIPKGVREFEESPAPPPERGRYVAEGIPGGSPSRLPPGIWSAAPWGATSAPPPVPRGAAKSQTVRVGGQVMAARILYNPKPEYPPLAIMARIQGTVVLAAVIGKDGTVQDLKVVRGHPLLVSAALAAVKDWRYQPTLLNGEPVEVITEITLNFVLGQ